MLARLGSAVALVLLATSAFGQTSAPSTSAQPFADMLRRSDPEAYARFVQLQDARDKSQAELLRAQQRYRTAGPELRALTMPELRTARRQYAADTRALLDFLDERDRKSIEEYRRAIDRINALIEERRRARDELDVLIRE
jgi:hypothetical protein